MNSAPSDKTRSVLKQMAQSGYGITYHGFNDSRYSINARVCAFCKFCLDHPTTAPMCRYACCSSAIQSFHSGEPFFQRCWAGLIFVTLAVAPEQECLGGLSAGGFVLEDEQQEARQELTQKLNALQRRDAPRFLDLLNTVSPIAPGALRGLGLLLMETSFTSGLNTEACFQKQNMKYIQQREIAEAMEEQKLERPAHADLLSETHQLISTLDQQDPESVRRFFSRYLARLLLASNWNLLKLKAHLRVLLAVLTSREILNGRDWTAATAQEMRYLHRLEASQTTEDSCYEVAQVILHHFAAPPAQASPLTERCTQWMQTHFQEHCSLNQLSKAVGAGVSSIVQTLRKKTGKTCHQILTEIRIAQSKNLLATSTLPLSEIGEMCGFYDQSHFTRTFKSATCLTPAQFRRLIP